MYDQFHATITLTPLRDKQYLSLILSIPAFPVVFFQSQNPVLVNLFLPTGILENSADLFDLKKENDWDIIKCILFSRVRRYSDIAVIYWY